MGTFQRVKQRQGRRRNSGTRLVNGFRQVVSGRFSKDRLNGPNRQNRSSNTKSNFNVRHRDTPFIRVAGK